MLRDGRTRRDPTFLFLSKTSLFPPFRRWDLRPPTFRPAETMAIRRSELGIIHERLHLPGGRRIDASRFLHRVCGGGGVRDQGGGYDWDSLLGDVVEVVSELGG